MSKLCTAYFSANSSWTAPPGVTRVMLIGQGGGMGGYGGLNATGGVNYGGYGTTPFMTHVNVVPNTSYTVTIGAGGTGGSPRTSSTANGGTGGNTTFGSLATFPGARAPSTLSPTNTCGFAKYPISNASSVVPYNYSSGHAYSTNNSGLDSGSYKGGTPGGAGFTGSVPGAAGDANSSGTGANGGNATGFGAGGGGGGSGSVAGGSGGNGAPGQLWVVWIE